MRHGLEAAVLAHFKPILSQGLDGRIAVGGREPRRVPGSGGDQSDLNPDRARKPGSNVLISVACVANWGLSPFSRRRSRGRQSRGSKRMPGGYCIAPTVFLSVSLNITRIPTRLISNGCMVSWPPWVSMAAPVAATSSAAIVYSNAVTPIPVTAARRFFRAPWVPPGLVWARQTSGGPHGSNVQPNISS